MEIIKNSVTQDLGYVAYDKLKRLILKGKNVIVALSGGSSVKPLYDSIKENIDDIKDWSRVRFVLADERVVDLNHEDSNYKFLKEYFLQEMIDKGAIYEEQIISINPNSKDVAKDYENKVGTKIDLAILGIGPDSHTCSLFPNHESIKDDSDGFINVNDSPKPPKRRISMSKKMVKDCKEIFAFFIGESKQEAFENYLNEEKSEIEVPIKIINECRNVYVFTNLN